MSAEHVELTQQMGLMRDEHLERLEGQNLTGREYYPITSLIDMVLYRGHFQMRGFRYMVGHHRGPIHYCTLNISLH